jgi:hypothetical protein
MRYLVSQERLLGEVYTMVDATPVNSSTRFNTGNVTAGATGGLVTFVLTVLLAVFGGDIPPLPTPDPLPPLPTPAPLPDVSPAPETVVRHTWVTDSAGQVLSATAEKPLIEASKTPFGSYTVHVLSNKLEERTVTVGGAPSPTPGPEPKPDPQPTPKPVADLWAIVIEESSQRTPQQAAVLASTELRALFAGKQFRVIDKDTNTDTQFARYIQQSVGQKLPLFWLVTPTGDVLYQGDLPSTPTAAVDLVKKWKVPK